MFKLLLVDDEVLTRENIINRLSWKDIGIDGVEQADDGLAALDVISRGFNPDIILTDLRMPNMDGIELSFKLKEILPNCKIIFMSGFSDKEYLKSAIQLQVINYIEKPLDLGELLEAIKNAVKECEKDCKKQLYEQTINKSIPFFRNEIALRLIKKHNDNILLDEWLELANLKLFHPTCFITIIVKIFRHQDNTPSQQNEVLSNVDSQIDAIFINSGLTGISAFKDDEHLIIHLLANAKEKHLLDSENIYTLCSQLSKLLSNSIDKFFISVGKIVSEISSIPDSYNTSVLALQKAFFYGYRSIVFYKDSSSAPFKFNENETSDFAIHLSKGDKERSILLIKRLTSEIKCFDTTHISHIKDIYYKLLLILYRYSTELGIVLPDNDKENHFWDSLSNFHTLNEFEEFAITRIDAFYKLLEAKTTSKSNITEIIRFIHNNYHDDQLSIKSISEHIYMNLNYLCFLFKQETGKTINQFITEYRIDRAKDLLRDKRIKVSDIAGQVGYKDGNYFAKLFRKATEFSPSEYRERCQQ